MPQNNLVRTPFTVDKNTEGVTYASTDLAGTATQQQLLKYSIPLGLVVEITPANYLFGEFYGTGGVTAADIIASGQTIIEKRNATGAASREIWKGSNGIFGDIGDELKRPRFKTTVQVNASQQIVVNVINMATTLDVSTSNFYLEANQIFEDLA